MSKNKSGSTVSLVTDGEVKTFVIEDDNRGFVVGNAKLKELDHTSDFGIAHELIDAHEEHQKIARRVKLEMLADAISLMIDAKIVESRGFAKYDTVGKARLTLINVLAEVV